MSQPRQLPRYKDWILETIDQLRKRKARPDLDRICHLVQRKHGLTFEETESDLEKLVDSETVIKVDYKGSTSYRNAAKWRKSHGQMLNSADASSKITSALRVLPGGLRQEHHDAEGVTENDLETWIKTQFTDSTLIGSQLKVALGREVEVGNIQKLPNGNYLIREQTLPQKRRKSASCNHAGSVGKTSLSKKGRPPSKRMRIKKTLGPEFESYDLLKSDQKCDYCLLTSASNRNGEPEELLVCRDCSAKAHPSCMDYSDELSRRARRSPWQCIDCKTCFVCEDAGDPDAMLFCDACDKGYHMNCHIPQILVKPKGKWACQSCLDEGVGDEFMESVNDSNGVPDIDPDSADNVGTSYFPTPRDSPSPAEPESAATTPMDASKSPPSLISTAVSRLPSSTSNADMTNDVTPDASSWTIDDVVDFFTKVGFAEQAQCFREQEIDGPSLLLMKRSDVLTGLSLKLGPALKIYVHVQRLQSTGKTFH